MILGSANGQKRTCATLRIIALIDDADVVERVLEHLKVWDPLPDTISPARPLARDLAADVLVVVVVCQ